MILMSVVFPAVVLLIADAAGWIDLSTRPLRRVVKWICAAVIAWFLPMILQTYFKLNINPAQLEIWKLFILGMLAAGLIGAMVKWLWRWYGPLPESFRRCPKCRAPVLKVMLECPVCKSPV